MLGALVVAAVEGECMSRRDVTGMWSQEMKDETG